MMPHHIRALYYLKSRQLRSGLLAWVDAFSIKNGCYYYQYALLGTILKFHYSSRVEYLGENGYSSRVEY